MIINSLFAFNIPARKPNIVKAHSKHSILTGIAWLMTAGLCQGEAVDPRFPSEHRPRQEEPERAWWLPSRIRQLETERAQLLQQISLLPQHNPKFLLDHLGYHSLVHDASENSENPVTEILCQLTMPHDLGAIAMAPAFNPLQSGETPYGFPKRFRIEVLNADTATYEVVVDWMNEDFPDPGPYPVFFADIDRKITGLKMTVARNEISEGMAYFALGELYLFTKNSQGQIGANMAIWDEKSMKFSVSDSFSMHPLWDLAYLHDGEDGFGFPLSDTTVDKEDCFIAFNDGRTDPEVEFVIDLGAYQNVGRIDFWPAQAPHNLALPSLGFPKHVTVRLSASPDFYDPLIFSARDTDRRLFRNNVFTVFSYMQAARYIGITIDGLPEYKGHTTLGIGEIAVSSNEKIISLNCPVTASGLPSAELYQLPRLVDGFSRHRRIMVQGEWIKGLAKRRPIDRRLAEVTAELAQKNELLRTLQLQASVLLGGVLCAGFLGALLLQKLQRRKALHALRWRITRDLHDEVGSSLGSVSMTADSLKSILPDGEWKKDLDDLSLLAREACASLREVVWLSDQSKIRLSDLVEKLVERAQRVLSGIELSVDIAPDCPDVVVSLNSKRHLIMFYKELIHNCVRHAHATRVELSIAFPGQQLQISFKDNGCGFDTSASFDGWGLESMRQRAQELRGELQLTSQPGKGTSVVLSVPLSALSQEPKQIYSTSN